MITITPSLNIGLGEFSIGLIDAFEKHLDCYDSSIKDLTVNQTLFIKRDTLYLHKTKECQTIPLLEQSGLNNISFQEKETINPKIQNKIYHYLDSSYFELMQLQRVLSDHFFRIDGGKTLIHILVPLFDPTALRILPILIDQLKHGCEIGNLVGVSLKIVGLFSRLSKEHFTDNTDNDQIDISCCYSSLLLLKSLQDNNKEFISNVILVDDINKDNLQINFTHESLAYALNELISASMLHHYSLFSNATEQGIVNAFGVGLMIYDSKLAKNYVRSFILDKGFKMDGVTDIPEHDFDDILNQTNKFVQAKSNLFSVYKKEKINKELTSHDFLSFALDWKKENPDNLDLKQISKEFQIKITDNLLGVSKKKVLDYSNTFQNECECFLAKQETSLSQSKAILGNFLEEKDTAISGEIYVSQQLNIEDIENDPREFFYQFMDDEDFVSLRDVKDIHHSISNTNDYVTKIQEDLDSIVTSSSEIDRIQESSFDGGIFSKNGIKFNANGYIPTPIHPDQVFYTPTTSTNLPNYIDLRPFFQSIKDQEDIPACTAFATASIYEYFAKRNNKKEVTVSELFIYYGARVAENEKIELTGTSMLSTFESLKTNGACFNKTWPFDTQKVNTTPPLQAFEEGKQFILHNAERVKQTEQDYKSALTEGFPVLIGIKLFPSFFEAESDGIVPFPDSKEISTFTNDDFHALVLVGYSEKEKIFVARNSWGVHFGDKGYVYLPFDYVTNKTFCPDAFIIKEITDLTIPNSSAQEGIEAFFFTNQSNKIKLNILRYKLQKAKAKLVLLQKEYQKAKQKYEFQKQELKDPEVRSNLLENQIHIIDTERENLFKTLYNTQDQFKQKGKLNKIWYHSMYAIPLLTLATYLLISLMGLSSPVIYALAVFLLLILAVSIYYFLQLKNIPLEEEVTKKDWFEYYAKELAPLENRKQKLRLEFKAASILLESIANYRQNLTKRYVSLSEYFKFLSSWQIDNNKFQQKISFETPIFVQPILNKKHLDEYIKSQEDIYMKSWPGLFSFFREHVIKSSCPASIEHIQAKLKQEILQGIEKIMTTFDQFEIIPYLCKKKKYPYLPQPETFDNFMERMYRSSNPFIQIAPGDTSQPLVTSCFLREHTEDHDQQFDEKMKNCFPDGGPTPIPTFSNNKVALLQIDFGVKIEDLIEYREGKRQFESLPKQKVEEFE